MPSEKQIVANRSNALKSTGPRSLAGKAGSSRNAVSHGLTAKLPLLPGESADEHDGLKHAMFSSLRPDGALETQIVERIFSLSWRLRRVPAFEMALLEWIAHSEAEQFDKPADPTELRNDPEQPMPDLGDPLTLGRTMETLLDSDLTNRLTRYETSMQKQLSQALKDLQVLQTPRRKFEEDVKKAVAIEKEKSKLLDPDDSPEYWAEQDRQRMQRMDPP